ncbi:MAG TPA: monovalent cation/H(+) antiporter subunit G [Fusibacter sp.]|nr:monovalent cation/H(+) antiporter subunit G [Fusibacter sp.]
MNLGTIIIYIGLIFVAFGIVGLFRFDNFYTRALTASKVDTVGYITILIGVMIKSGFTFLTLKVGVLLVITLIINPLTTHMITRSAYVSGYTIKKEKT